MAIYNVWQQCKMFKDEANPPLKVGPNLWTQYETRLKHVGTIEAENGHAAIDLAREHFPCFKKGTKLGRFPIVEKIKSRDEEIWAEQELEQEAMLGLRPSFTVQ